MEIRKMFKAGNSHVVSIPHDMIFELGLKEGSQLIIEFDKERRILTIRPLDLNKGALLVSQDYAAMVEEFIDEYEIALKELAR